MERSIHLQCVFNSTPTVSQAQEDAGLRAAGVYSVHPDDKYVPKFPDAKSSYSPVASPSVTSTTTQPVSAGEQICPTWGPHKGNATVRPYAPPQPSPPPAPMSMPRVLSSLSTTPVTHVPPPKMYSVTPPPGYNNIGSLNYVRPLDRPSIWR
jgi:hypothetical protein